MPIGISNLCKRMQPSATLAISEKAKQLKAEGFKVISFGVGEPDFTTPSFICDAVNEAMKLGMTKYTAVSGTPELKKAIIDKLKRENNLNYLPKQIIVSNGAKHSLFNCFQAILNYGDEVIIPTPCWVSYPEIVGMSGGVPVFVKSTQENNFIPSIDDIKAKITNKTKAIIINSPSNPNGTRWDKNTLEALAKLAVEKQFYIVSDEIYEKLIYDDNLHYSIANVSEAAKDITILINGVSKSFAMTGFRIGYAAGPEDVISAMGKYQSQSTSNPNSLAQHATVVALNSDQSTCETMRQAYSQRRIILANMINEVKGISCLVPSGAFYIMIDVHKLFGKNLNGDIIKTSDDFTRLLLKEEQVAVVSGESFMAEGYIRVSYALSEDDIIEGANRIKRFVEKLQE